MSKDERIIQNQDNKTIRHEDYIAGIGKGMILDSFSSNQHRLNISMAAEKLGLPEQQQDVIY